MLNVYIKAIFFPRFNVGSSRAKYIYWFFYLSLLMAFLELGQDYISSVLNDNYFSLGQSLSYKLFWLLFPLFSIGLVAWYHKTESYSSKVLQAVLGTLIILLITLAHLLVFSLLLFGISNMFYEESVSVYFLITEKLSTRLYIGLSIYIIFSALYYYHSKQQSVENHEKEQNQIKNITVKNGRTTTLVDVNTINWIGSDGHYLSVHTENKEHVILDSLKNIITSLPENFKRIHRSTILNTNRVKKLKSRGNGDYDVIMNDGTILRLSRNYTEPLRDLLL